MSIEKRTVRDRHGKETEVDFDTVLGGAVVHHKDPEKVVAAIKAAKTRKKNEKAEAITDAEPVEHVTP